MRRTGTTLFVAAVVALAVAPASASACDCNTISFYPYAYAAANTRQVDYEIRPNDRAIVTYRILRVFKDRGGTLQEQGEVEIRTHQNGATCGLPNRKGQRVGVMFYRNNGKLTASLCSVTSPRQLREQAKKNGDTQHELGAASSCEAA